MKITNLLVILLFAFATTVHAGGLSRIRVYIQNPTSGLLRYSYRMGGDDWAKKTINSGYTQTLTGIGPHYIRYDNGRGKTIQYKIDTGATYYFRWSQKTLYFLRK